MKKHLRWMMSILVSLAIAFTLASQPNCKGLNQKKLKKMGKDLKKSVNKLIKKGSKTKYKKKDRKKPKKTKTVEKGPGKKKSGKLIYEIDIDKAIGIAKKQNRKVLAIISTKGCYPCQQMKEQVYPDKQVKKELKKYVIVTDGYTSGIKAHGDPYLGAKSGQLTEGGMYYTPTFGVWDKNGKFLRKEVGAMDKPDFIEFLKK